MEGDIFYDKQGNRDIFDFNCFCIAAGFVLRVYIGGIATETEVSDWLFLTIVVMSLFMGFGKRHGEMLKVDGPMTRKVLMQHDIGFLSGMMFTCAGLTIVLLYGNTLGDGWK